MATINRQDLGPVSAYAEAVAQGFTGTIEEWYAYIAGASTAAQTAVQNAESAAASAETATAAAADAASVAYGMPVRYDAQQSLTEAQKACARNNIDVLGNGTFDDVKSAFIHGATQYTYENGYINCSGTTVDPTAIVTSTNYKHVIIDCEEGDAFLINGTGAPAARIWCFIDSENNIVSTIPTNYSNETIVNQIVVAPHNAVKLISNYRVDRTERPLIYKLNAVEYLTASKSGAAEITSGADINLYVNPGSYFIRDAETALSLQSWPTNVAGRMFVYQINSAALVYQEVIDAENRKYTRRKNNSGWSDWERTATKKSVDDSIAGSSVSTEFSYTTVIPEGADLDDYTTPGNYSVTSLAIADSLIHKAASASGRLVVLQTASTSNVAQVYVSTLNKMYIRGKDNSGWSEWRSIMAGYDYREAVTIPENADMDDYIEPGTYLVPRAAIVPTLVSWPATDAGRLFVYTLNGPTLVYQEIVTTNSVKYSRRKNNSGWSEWERMATTSEIPEVKPSIILDQTDVITIQAGDDLDSYTTVGTYKIATMADAKKVAHCPSSYAGKIIVTTTNSNSAHHQIYLANDGQVYARVYSGGAWLDWVACSEKNSLAENELDTLGTMSTAHEIKSALTYKKAFANGTVPLKLRSYIGNSQNVHPKVLYFAEGFGGHKYWMAYTPYPYSNDRVENPCVAFSDDGFKWTNIEGNPLSDPNGNGYNSDTHLVYREDTGVLECWYRYVGDASEQVREETIFRRTTTDGITWTAEEQVYSNTSGNYARLLSPAVIFESGTYRIWVVQQKTGEAIKIVYYEAPGSNVTEWTKVREIELTYTDNGLRVYPWHMDAIKDGNTYILLVMCRNGTDIANNHCSLFITTSTDNINYTSPYIAVEGSAHGWDRYMYRSSIVKIGNTYRIYYSAGAGGISTIYSGSIWGIGITESDSLSDFIGY